MCVLQAPSLEIGLKVSYKDSLIMTWNQIESTCCMQNCDTITLFEAVANEPKLSMLVTVIEAGGLMYGNPLGNVTVFAPNNQAFIGANGFFTQLCVSGTNLNAIAAQ